jgi:hypothetical protein
MLSGNQSRLYLSSCFFSCSPAVLQTKKTVLVEYSELFNYFLFLDNIFIENHFPKNSNKLTSTYWLDCDFRRFKDNITRDLNSFFWRLGSELLQYQLASVLFTVCAEHRAKLLKEISCTLHKMAVHTNEIFSVWEKLALCQDQCSSV